MHRSVSAFFSGLFVTLAASTAAATLNVVTTTSDLASLSKAVGGDLVDVKSLSRGWQDPHFVDAKPSLMLQVHQANLVVSIGLDLEIGWLPGVLIGARNPDVNVGGNGYLEAGTVIAPIEVMSVVDRTQGDVHPRGNPHFLGDPLNAKLVAAAIAARLARLDAPNAAAYAAGAKRFSDEIDARMPAWSSRVAAAKSAPIVTYHRTLNYFFARFGLKGFDYVEPKPGIPPSPAHIADLIGRMKAAGVTLILVESFYDPRVPQLIADHAGAKVKVVASSVEATPEAKDYFTLIDLLVEAVAGKAP